MQTGDPSLSTQSSTDQDCFSLAYWNSFFFLLFFLLRCLRWFSFSFSACKSHFLQAVSHSLATDIDSSFHPFVSHCFVVYLLCFNLFFFFCPDALMSSLVCQFPLPDFLYCLCLVSVLNAADWEQTTYFSNIPYDLYDGCQSLARHFILSGLRE